MIEFPPAHLPLNEYKAAREQSVFQKFAAYGCRNLDFGVTVETITSRNPPEPDIICNISSYGPAAFELAEIRDERAMRAMSTMMDARDAFLSHPLVLPTEDQIAFQTKFAMRQARVAFRRDRSLRHLRRPFQRSIDGSFTTWPTTFRWTL